MISGYLDEQLADKIHLALIENHTDAYGNLLQDILTIFPRWMPLASYTPLHDGDYLISTECCTMEAEWKDGAFVEMYNGELVTIKNVLAWMPLPTRYIPASYKPVGEDSA